MPMVRCADCGFFFGTRAFGEDDLFPDRGQRDIGVFHAQPACFRSAYNLGKELISAGGYADSWNAVVRGERSCAEFVQWEPGLSPREHLQMLWDQRQQAREDAARQRHDEQMEIFRGEERRRASREHWLIALGVFIALVQAGVGIVIAFK